MGYIEHKVMELDGGLKVVDATVSGLRQHDDLIWIEINGGGRWVTPLEAVAYSRAIQEVVAFHCERRALAAVK